MSVPEKHEPYEVLARRYRPQRFEDLIGQEHVARTLQNAIRSGKLAHAFLFTGIRGVGKTTAARLLARAMNCLRSSEPTPEPCPVPRDETACDNCRDIAESRSLDVAEIDGASNRGIDSIRELNDNVRYRPASGRYRVYIIDEAHMVTREGFNALLKTLEEPPPHVKFIFATTAIDKFPDTIVSRCQRYDFRRIPVRRISDHLGEIARAENVRVSDRALYVIAREGQGSMRDAESLLDRLIAFSAEGSDGDSVEVSDERVGEVLGVTDRQTLYAVAESVLRGDARKTLEQLDAIHASGRDLERFSRDLLEHWRNLTVAALYEGGAGALQDLPEDEIAELGKQATLRSLTDVQRLFRVALQGDVEMRGAELPRLVLEMNLIRMATLEPVVSVDEVLARLDELGAGGPRGGGSGPAPRVRQETAGGPAPSRPPATSSRTAPPEKRPLEPSGRREPVAETASAPAVSSTPPPPSQASSPGEGRWEELLEFVRERRVSLYLTMSHARVIEAQAGRLVLGVSGERFRRELESPGTLQQCEKLAGEFFGGTVRISILALEEERPKVAPAPSANATLENPAVRKVVETLGGEVREVRNRR